jgi:Amt family ammonium transporter
MTGVPGVVEGSFDQLIVQAQAVLGTLAYSGIASYVILLVLDKIPGLGLRVSEAEEDQGLDLSVHGERAMVDDGAD